MTDPKFLDPVTCIGASDDNPVKHGFYVRRLSPTNIEATDKQGNFWNLTDGNWRVRPEARMTGDMGKVRGVLQWVSDAFKSYKSIPAYIAADANESLAELDRIQADNAAMDVLTDDTLYTIEAREYGYDCHQVWLKIGNQEFKIGQAWDTAKEAAWGVQMLSKAIASVIAQSKGVTEAGDARAIVERIEKECVESDGQGYGLTDRESAVEIITHSLATARREGMEEAARICAEIYNSRTNAYEDRFNAGVSVCESAIRKTITEGDKG